MNVILEFQHRYACRERLGLVFQKKYYNVRQWEFGPQQQKIFSQTFPGISYVLEASIGKTLNLYQLQNLIHV